MKLFKKKKNLKEENANLLQKLSIAEKKIDRLEMQVDGERIASPYCERCVHSILVSTIYYGFGESTSHYLCSLNCKCKDYARKD